MKKKILYGALVCLVIIVAYAFYIPKTTPLGPVEDGAVRIMSYNLKYGSSDLETFSERKDLIVKQILNYQPDSIGIQEGDYYWMTEFGGLPELLEGYAFVGVGRTDGEYDGEFAAIFYLEDKYDVLESGTFWLSETPDEPSIGWDAADYRICTWVTLKNNDTEEIYTHYNTHLDHIGEEARMKGVEVILDVISEETTPYVLTGDFNVLEKSDVYNVLVDSNLLFDTRLLAVDSMKHGTANWFLPFNFQLVPAIDFVFVGEDIDVSVYSVDNSVWFNKRPVSDHYPVISDIIIK